MNKKRLYSKTQNSFRAMTWRNNPNNKQDYKYYKNVGICEEWTGVDGFVQFVIDMGKAPDGMTIERVDNKKGYSKENCIWATRKDQSINTNRHKRLIDSPIYKKCKECGIRYGSVYARSNRDDTSLEDAFEKVKRSYEIYDEIRSGKNK